ncbi:MAG TPA: Gfo/Idh/MocA family oxidoreductase [Ktedonobacteraceae bacterium]
MQCSWGVLGPGFVATRAVIPAIQRSRNGRVRALASRNLEHARELAGQWNVERAYEDYQQLLDDPAIDAVYLALPNHLHYAWTIRAAQAGKHVLCEKPLACTASEGEQMWETCRLAGVQLMEAAMYRFHPRSQRLHQLATDGTLGQPRFLHSTFTFTLNSPRNYRLTLEYGGGALLDVGCYCVNALCWLAGTSSIEVLSHAVQRETGGVDLDAGALLRFADGALGHFQCSFAAAEHQSIELIGGEGAVTAPLAFTAWHADTTTLRIQHRGRIIHEEFAPVDPYQLMVEHFASALQGETGISYPPQEALQTLRVLDRVRARW